VLLLAHTDTLHGTLSGLATKKLMERAYGVFSDVRYQRLATISVAHLYNLRQQPKYQQQRQIWTKTRPTTVPIRERSASVPDNRPGYLRVDSVHQGDQDGMKGVYHINAVDCVTQYEGVPSQASGWIDTIEVSEMNSSSTRCHPASPGHLSSRPQNGSAGSVPTPRTR
jgi:hypothetical protein